MNTTHRTVRRAKGTSYWSEEIGGDVHSYYRTVSFAVTDNYVTIYQRDDERGITEAILLSPGQYKALVGFVERGEHEL